MPTSLSGQSANSTICAKGPETATCSTTAGSSTVRPTESVNCLVAGRAPAGGSAPSGAGVSDGTGVSTGGCVAAGVPVEQPRAEAAITATSRYTRSFLILSSSLLHVIMLYGIGNIPRIQDDHAEHALCGKKIREFRHTCFREPRLDLRRVQRPISAENVSVKNGTLSAVSSAQAL